MKVYKDIKQKSVEWHRLKWAMLSASITKELMNTKPIEDTAILFKLLHQTNEDFNEENVEDEWISKDVERGNILEPVAVHEIEKKMDIDFEEFGFLISEKYPMLGLSPDRLTSNLKKGCEVKCPAGNTHAKWIFQKDLIPLDHIWQVISYFLVNEDLEVLYLASYRPEHKKMPLYMVTVTLDTKINVGTPKKPVIMTVEESMSLFDSRYEELIKLIDEQNKN